MSNPAAKRGLPRSYLLAALVCGVSVIALLQFFGNASRGYVNTSSLFWWWVSQWLDPNADTEHGWLILGLSAWLLWRGLHRADGGLRIADLAKPETGNRIPDSLIPAVAAMAAGLLLHALGFAAQQARVSIIALLVFTWGVLRLGGGPRWGNAALFPLAFMVFAIPINALDSIGFWLRVWVVDASGAVARAAGIGVLQSGTQLVAPDGSYNYDVAAACSGIRSLTAMAALSLLAGYLNFQSWPRRALVLLLCFPLVYLGNVSRILAIIFAAQAGGPKWGDVAHDVMGYGIFVIVLGGVLAAITLLRRFWPERSAAISHSLEDKPVCHLMDDKRAWGVAGLVAGLALAEAVFLHHLANSPPRGEVGVALTADGRDPVKLPAFIGTEWIGRRAEVSAVEREILPVDTGFSRKTYVALDDPKKSVFLSIVLSGRDRTSIHRPELCLVGQGWTISEAIDHSFRYPGRADAPFPVRVLRVRREVQTRQGKTVVPELVAYWFVGHEVVVGTHWQRVIRDSWNRVAHARADRWAYVLMQTNAADGEAAALARMQAVLDATLPAFQKPVAK